MTRSLKHLLQVIDDLEKRRVGLISLRENIDTSTATGRFFISIMGAIAQMERAFLVKFFSLTSERSEGS
jgi:DNA invertase Pin-like site-specific DNA recombinase